VKWSLEHGMCVRRFGDGPELVWIHGLGESSQAFDSVAEQLPGFTHVLPDLPGYSRSPWIDPLGLDALAEHLARWLGERAPAALVGHSMGGVLATLIAERAPVRAVVNIDGNVSSGDCTFSGRALEVGFAQLKSEVLGKPGVPSTYYAAMCFASPDMFHRHARDLVELSATEQLAPRFAALRVPALFIAGVPDGICAESRALLDRAGARWVGIEDSGHWVYLDQPARFVAEVAAFLQ
jgi:pimeloyl-ACP methyl ester carboxylesterase